MSYHDADCASVVDAMAIENRYLDSYLESVPTRDLVYNILIAQTPEAMKAARLSLWADIEKFIRDNYAGEIENRAEYAARERAMEFRAEQAEYAEER